MSLIRKLSRDKCDEIINNFTLNKEFEGIFSYVNGYSYLILRKLKKQCESFDGFFSDGIYLIFFYNLFFKKKIKRVTFDMTSLAPVVFDYCINLDKKIYFLGGKQDEIEKFIRLINEKYPRLHVAGYQNGYNKDTALVIQQVREASPDIVIVGLGCPHQENFLVCLKETGWRGIGFTCGAFISQTQENIDYYPKFINTLNLRWLYRLVKERHTRQRFFNSYPIFPVVFIKDILRTKYKKAL